MVVETPDPAHPRHTMIRLTDQTRMAISAYLGSLFALGLGPDSTMPDFPPLRG